MTSNAKQGPRPRVVLVNRTFLRRNDGKILIIKRSPNDANNAEKWEVPGGKVEENQDLILAEDLELMQETGLTSHPIARMAYTISFMIGAGRYKGLPYLALFHIGRLEGGVLKLSHEHTDHKWVTYDEMLTYDLTYEVRKAAIKLNNYLQ